MHGHKVIHQITYMILNKQHVLAMATFANCIRFTFGMTLVILIE